MYATIGTQPNIAYATNKLCSFNSDLDFIHWGMAKQVLWYLKGAKEQGITYKRGGENWNHIYRYVDAGYACEPGCISRSGYTFILNNGAITVE